MQLNQGMGSASAKIRMPSATQFVSWQCRQMHSLICCLCSLLRKLRERQPKSVLIWNLSAQLSDFLRQKHLKADSRVQKQLRLANMWSWREGYILLMWFYGCISMCLGCLEETHPANLPQQKFYSQKACLCAQLTKAYVGSEGGDSIPLKKLVKADGLQMQATSNFTEQSAVGISSDRQSRQTMFMFALPQILMISLPQMPHMRYLLGMDVFLRVSLSWKERHSLMRVFSSYATLPMMKPTSLFLIKTSKTQCQCASRLKNVLLWGISSLQLVSSWLSYFSFIISMNLVSWLLDLRRTDHLISTAIPYPLLTRQECSWPCPNITKSPFLCTPRQAWNLGELIALISFSSHNLILPLRVYSSWGRLIHSTTESLARQYTSRNSDCGQCSQYSSVARRKKRVLDSSPLPQESTSYLVSGASYGGRHSKKGCILPNVLLEIGMVRQRDLVDSSNPSCCDGGTYENRCWISSFSMVLSRALLLRTRLALMTSEKWTILQKLKVYTLHQHTLTE